MNFRRVKENNDKVFMVRPHGYFLNPQTHESHFYKAEVFIVEKELITYNSIFHSKVYLNCEEDCVRSPVQIKWILFYSKQNKSIVVK